jgi:hypothetical protein
MPSESTTHDLSAAYELLKQWTDIGEADSYEALGPAAVYKTSVVLWLMLFQRLNPKASLRDAVLHFVETAPDELKTNKRLREGSLSTKSGSYNVSRRRSSIRQSHRSMINACF